MAVITSSTPSLTISYTMSDSSTIATFTESSSVGYSAFSFTNGTGMGKVNAGITITGILPSGQNVELDFSGLTKNLLGSEQKYQFSQDVAATYPLGGGPQIRGILVTNTYAGLEGTGIGYFTHNNLPYFTIVASGTAGFSGLFGGYIPTLPASQGFGNGSGNIPVYPQSTWAHTSYRGVKPTADNNASYPNQHKLFLNDSGSGLPYEIVVVGVTGTSIEP